MTIAGRWIFTGENVEITVSDGKIDRVEKIDRQSEESIYLSPGFFDSQVNGYLGSDYSMNDLTLSHISKICDEMMRSGTNRHLATVVTSPQERILKNLSLIADAIDADEDKPRAIAGIHVEGPYISGEDGPRGAHDAEYVRDPDVGELREWIDASRNSLVVVTLAPEREGAIRYIEALNESNIVASIGHSGASPEQIRAAIGAGAKLSTHLGNGSHAMMPRLKNYLWEQLAADELYMGMICDGYHLPAAVVKSMIRAKGHERTILVSDVALFGGFEPGRYKWGNIDVEVHPDGHLGVADTPYLAGAGHTLARCLSRFVEFTGGDLADAVRLCTKTPSALFGFDFSENLPAPGAPADLVRFAYQPGMDSLDIRNVIRGRRHI